MMIHVRQRHTCVTMTLILPLLVTLHWFVWETRAFVPPQHRQLPTSLTFASSSPSSFKRVQLFVSSSKAAASADASLPSSKNHNDKNKKANSKKPNHRRRNNNRRRVVPSSPATTTKQSRTTPTTTETWRIFNVEVHPDELQLDLQKERSIRYQQGQGQGQRQPNQQQILQEQFLHPSVLTSLCQRLRSTNKNDKNNNQQDILSSQNIQNIRVVRRSLDARSGQGRRRRRQDGGSGPRFVFVVDVDIPPTSNFRLRHEPGKLECLGEAAAAAVEAVATMKEDTSNVDDNNEIKRKEQDTSSVDKTSRVPHSNKRVIIVGAGPAGLFCALRLAREQPNITPILLERGQAVEVRGKDIGALMHRRVLQPESNYAFGEGGAGTWSDGKLTTRIGRNSAAVRQVLETLVHYGAPPWILLDGSPHLGTDNLVRLLRNMRLDLRKQGGQVHFGTKVTGFVIEDGVVRGVHYEHQPAVERNLDENDDAFTPIELDEKGTLYGDAVVLATGHSARDVYEQLHAAGVQLEPKGFAVGFRIEHPQKLINKIQYGGEWGPSVVTGKETTDTENSHFFQQQSNEFREDWHEGRLPVPSYRLATDKAFDGTTNRGVYSFCMCPGGQIVPASTDPEEVCVNGMSFSRRDSLWANSALVVTVNPGDPILDSYRREHGVLAGVAFQRAMERKAAEMGGGNLCVPVQRVTDFIQGRASETAPSSSYRLGVQPSACHEIYPAELTAALKHALVEFFDKQMPGYICDEGLLHAVETRTSSPVRVSRDDVNLEAIGLSGLFPAGEGAGFAGGIVSAAVDGMVVGEAVLDLFEGTDSETGKRRSSSASRNTGNFY